MALEEIHAPLGAPWSRPMRGSFECLAVRSELLAGNPLGDPADRPLYVYRAQGVSPGAPVVLMLQGYSGQLDSWLAREAFEPTVPERLDAMFTGTDTPAATVAFVDGWTRLGGAQFINSAGTGRYADYICDEVLPFLAKRYDTGAAGVCGHSSGGYGAMVLSMLRPDRFSAFASLAGDALFECSYLPEFPRVARTLRDHFDGSFQTLLERVEQAQRFDFELFGPPLSLYAMAAAYSPDPDRPTEPQLPLDLRTGRAIPEVWERWLEHDPVRMAPRHAEALRSMRRIHLDGGRRDEFYLDLAAEAFGRELDALGVSHTLELFDGGHGGARVRYPHAVRELVLALAQ